MFSGAIFDVDGTILDSLGVWEGMTARFLEKYNIKMSEQMAAEFRNMTLEVSLPYIVSEFKLNIDSKAVFEEFSRMAAAEYTTHVLPKSGALEYIRRISAAGVKIAIATSGFPAACQSAFEKLGIGSLISAYAFSGEVGVDKSHPDVYLLAAQRIGVEPGKCMVFEDLLAGINGAKLAGMQTTAVFDRYNDAETAQLKKRADRYITDWSELNDFAG